MMSKRNYINDLDDIRLTKEFIFLNPYRFIVVFIYSIIFFVIGSCIWLSVTHKQETIDVQGSLMSSNKIQEIQVLIGGVVDKVYVQEGMYVEKGQNILSLRSDKLVSQKDELTKKMEEAQNHLTYLVQLQDCLDNKKNTFQNNETEGYYYAQVEKYLSSIKALEVGSSSEELDALSSQKKNLQELMNAIANGTMLDSDHTYYSQIELYNMELAKYQTKMEQIQLLIQTEIDSTLSAQYQQQLNALNIEKDNFIEQKQLEVQQQIDTLNVKIEQTQNLMKETRKKTESEIEQLKSNTIVEIKTKEQELKNTIQEYKSSLESIDIDLSSYNLSASESGYVSYKNKVKEGDVLSTGVVIGSLNTAKDDEENFEVTLNVPSSGIGFIKTGQSIKLTIDGLTRKDYGFIHGTVKKIYDSPIQVNEGVFYKVTASIDIKQDNGIYNKVFALKDNMSVQANIITKETSWMKYLLQKMNIFKDTSEST